MPRIGQEKMTELEVYCVILSLAHDKLKQYERGFSNGKRPHLIQEQVKTLRKTIDWIEKRVLEVQL
jgi:hypothetical protein